LVPSLVVRRSYTLAPWLLLGLLTLAPILAHSQSFTGPSALESASSPGPYAGLPEAPSAVLFTPGAPPPDPTFVNGRAYHKPTRREDLRAYEHELIGPRPFLSAAIRSAIEQVRPVPIGWGQDFPGYLQRYGSAYAEFAIDSSVRYALAGALHEDVRYIICHKCSAGDKLANAFLAEMTARHGEDGHRAFSLTPVAAGFSGPLIAYAAWYPPGYTEGDAAKHAFFGFGFRIVGHIVREFFFDKDTKAALNP
jgi:hypothetical protein